MILKFNDLRVRCVVGVRDWEQKREREVILQVEIQCDCPRAPESDALEDALDYSALNERIIGYVQGNRFGLIEKLAFGVAELCLEEAKAKSVRVEAEKPGALRYARSVSAVCQLAKGEG